MLASVRIRVRPEDVRALEATARSVTRLDFTVPTAPDACARTTASSLEQLGLGSAMAGAALMAGGRAGLRKVMVRGTFTPRAGTTDVSLVGLVAELVPLTVTSTLLGLAAAAATLMACFTLRLSPILAGVGMVVVAIAASVLWSKWRAASATKATAVLADTFRRLRTELDG
jgi:hypothetical protein